MVQSRAAAKKKTGDIWGDDEGSGSHGAFSSPRWCSTNPGVELVLRIVADPAVSGVYHHPVVAGNELWPSIMVGEAKDGATPAVVVQVQEDLDVEEHLHAVLSRVDTFCGSHRRASDVCQANGAQALHLEGTTVDHPANDPRGLGGMAEGSRGGGQEGEDDKKGSQGHGDLMGSAKIKLSPFAGPLSPAEPDPCVLIPRRGEEAPGAEGGTIR